MNQSHINTIRLEHASRYLAGMATNPVHMTETFEERAEWALAQADALLSVVNKAPIAADRDAALPVILWMYERTGGFTKSLAQAMLHADEYNLQRLIDAFPHYWSEALRKVVENNTA